MIYAISKYVKSIRAFFVLDTLHTFLKRSKIRAHNNCMVERQCRRSIPFSGYSAPSDTDGTIQGANITVSFVGKLKKTIDELLFRIFLLALFTISSWDQIDNAELEKHIKRVGVVI